MIAGGKIKDPSSLPSDSFNFSQILSALIVDALQRKYLMSLKYLRASFSNYSNFISDLKPILPLHKERSKTLRLCEKEVMRYSMNGLVFP